LGLIFLRYADSKFTDAQQEFADKAGSGRRQIGPTDYHAQGILYIPDEARFETLKILPESDEVKVLQVQIDNLRTTRDLLLPKLISGDLDVSELDIETKEAI